MLPVQVRELRSHGSIVASPALSWRDGSVHVEGGSNGRHP
jgi:hypothetical protein